LTFVGKKLQSERLAGKYSPDVSRRITGVEERPRAGELGTEGANLAGCKAR
jgi:hypothetical protein